MFRKAKCDVAMARCPECCEPGEELKAQQDDVPTVRLVLRAARTPKL
jgi:hypothetical protein